MREANASLQYYLRTLKVILQVTVIFLLFQREIVKLKQSCLSHILFKL